MRDRKRRRTRLEVIRDSDRVVLNQGGAPGGQLRVVRAREEDRAELLCGGEALARSRGGAPDTGNEANCDGHLLGVSEAIL